MGARLRARWQCSPASNAGGEGALSLWTPPPHLLILKLSDISFILVWCFLYNRKALSAFGFSRFHGKHANAQFWCVFLILCVVCSFGGIYQCAIFWRHSSSGPCQSVRLILSLSLLAPKGHNSFYDDVDATFERSRMMPSEPGIVVARCVS